MRVFQTNVSWWFFTGVWVTASFLKSAELFSIFWPMSLLVLLLIFCFSSPYTIPLVTVPSASNTIGITVTFRFLRFFNLTLWSAEMAKSTILQVLFILLIIIRSGRLAGIRWFVCIPKSLRRLCFIIFKYFTHLSVFHIRISWLVSTGVWETASLLKSPGLF